MGPTRLTLIAAGAGVLAACLVLGPLALVSIQNYEAPDERALQEGSVSAPAAQDAFREGLVSQDAAFRDERMELTMEFWGTGEVLLGEGLVRVDPDSGDYEFSMMIDYLGIAEAYGIDASDEGEERADDGLWEDEDPFGMQETGRFEMAFSRVDEVHVLGFGDQKWGWRDFSPDEDFTFFSDEDEDATEDPLDPEMSMGTDELRRFIEANESVALHEIEASEWEGVPSWRIKTSITEDDVVGEAVMHFRQSDMAPLAVDMVMDGLFDDGFLGFVHEQDPEYDLSMLEDFEMTLQMRFRYGSGFDIRTPDDFTKVGVRLETDDEELDDRIIRTLNEMHDEVVPLDDLELHVAVLDLQAMQEQFIGGPVVVETLAVLDLADALNGTVDGYTIVYEDNDGDGRLSTGDRLHLTAEEEGGIWSNQTQAVALIVFDKWAEQYEGAPAPGALILVALVSLGLAALRRRRSR